MNKRQVQELIDLVKENDLSAIEIEEKDIRVRIEKNMMSTQMPVAQVPTITIEETKDDSKEEEQFSGFEVKSPLVGVFYDANGPDEEAFVTVGSTVKEGDTLCIIESMKVMNEISTPRSGVIKKILMKKGELVEFEQPLFIIE